MAKRKTELGLGRGLNALLGDPELSASGEGSVSLPISQVEPGLNQPRKRFDPDTIRRLEQLRWWDWPREKLRQLLPLLRRGELAALERAAEDI